MDSTQGMGNRGFGRGWGVDCVKKKKGSKNCEQGGGSKKGK